MRVFVRDVNVTIDAKLLFLMHKKSDVFCY